MRGRRRDHSLALVPADRNEMRAVLAAMRRVTAASGRELHELGRHEYRALREAAADPAAPSNGTVLATFGGWERLRDQAAFRSSP